MSTASTLYTLLALASLVPAFVRAAETDPAANPRFVWGLGLAVIGPVAWAAAQLPDAWNAGLSATLWIEVAASMIVFAIVAVADKQARRLTLLLIPYLFVLGLLGAAFGWLGAPPAEAVVTPWFGVHIAVAVGTLGLLTVAAVGASASYLQAHALKAKRQTWLSRRLPSASDSDRISARLLVAAEIVLAIGIISGMALERDETGSLLQPDHKTMMTIAGFVVIALLLVGRRFLGIPGQVAARIVLLAYLLVVLGYFGVKIVHQLPIA